MESAAVYPNPPTAPRGARPAGSGNIRPAFGKSSISLERQPTSQSARSRFFTRTAHEGLTHPGHDRGAHKAASRRLAQDLLVRLRLPAAPESTCEQNHEQYQVAHRRDRRQLGIPTDVPVPAEVVPARPSLIMVLQPVTSITTATRVAATSSRRCIAGLPVRTTIACTANSNSQDRAINACRKNPAGSPAPALRSCPASPAELPRSFGARPAMASPIAPPTVRECQRCSRSGSNKNMSASYSARDVAFIAAG